uniref:Uncharacterized protein n=1 Tax=Anopheles dirus TaxID=7168 RepID=A0A182N1G3_9DIPT
MLIGPVRTAATGTIRSVDVTGGTLGLHARHGNGRHPEGAGRGGPVRELVAVRAGRRRVRHRDRQDVHGRAAVPERGHHPGAGGRGDRGDRWHRAGGVPGAGAASGAPSRAGLPAAGPGRGAVRAAAPGGARLHVHGRPARSALVRQRAAVRAPGPGAASGARRARQLCRRDLPARRPHRRRARAAPAVQLPVALPADAAAPAAAGPVAARWPRGARVRPRLHRGPRRRPRRPAPPPAAGRQRAGRVRPLEAGRRAGGARAGAGAGGGRGARHGQQLHAGAGARHRPPAPLADHAGAVREGAHLPVDVAVHEEPGAGRAHDRAAGDGRDARRLQRGVLQRLRAGGAVRPGQGRRAGGPSVPRGAPSGRIGRVAARERAAAAAAAAAAV